MRCSAAELRNTLLTLTSGKVKVLRLEWHEDSPATSESDGHEAMLKVYDMETLRMTIFSLEAGFNTVLEAIGLSRQEFQAKSTRPEGAAQVFITRKDHEFVIDKIS